MQNLSKSEASELRLKLMEQRMYINERIIALLNETDIMKKQQEELEKIINAD